MQPTLQDNQLMSKHRVLSFKPYLRPEWRGQDGRSETAQPDHSASLSDSIRIIGSKDILQAAMAGKQIENGNGCGFVRNGAPLRIKL
jgi:hypothetical protein